SKNLFITVGSTQFESLIHHLLNKEVLSLLFNNHFETVNLQVGNTKVNQNELLKLKNEFKNKMTINLFDFNQSLTHFYREADFVISHAGSGSIIEALRLKKKLLVVVNNKLMDNHQKELAIEMKKNNY
ncbi:glycosyl transferase, partial [Neoconidiobolus thromboides FSU 785]